MRPHGDAAGASAALSHASQIDHEPSYSARPADAIDWTLIYASAVEVPAAWTGLAIERDGVVVAIASVVWDPFGRAWPLYHQTAVVPPRLVASAVLRVVRAVRQSGEQTLHAIAEEAVPSMADRLRRAGFRPEHDPDLNREIWVLKWA